MKINFLLTKKLKDSSGYDWKLVATFKEAQALEKKGYINRFSPQCEILLKQLLLNQDFVMEMDVFRAVYDLPENSDYEKYLHATFYGLKDKTDLQKCYEAREAIARHINFIVNQYTMHPLVHINIDFLLISGFIAMGIPKDIEILTSQEQETAFYLNRQPIGIQIQINDPNVKYDYFKKVIHSKWKEEILPRQRELLNTDFTIVSTRNIEIVELRRSGRRFSEIAEILTKKYPKAGLDYDSARKAYNDSEKYISALFRPI
jgi:hypothetical protein